ncbi:2,3-bisphosphoglycerate-independent phosphoglycerate mutase [Candidatus Woesebacteria bacterium]|nr:2,3-bisphosphoglycerate-independent phosphoglycerate mutase [Candidatus Woesebacteria bacterium]
MIDQSQSPASGTASFIAPSLVPVETTPQVPLTSNTIVDATTVDTTPVSPPTPVAQSPEPTELTQQPAAQSTQAATDVPTTDLTPIITKSDVPIGGDHTYNGPKPTILLILDGWGVGPSNAGNAITEAKTPNLDRYWMSYPHTQLEASGQAVGLPQGEDGNTETGHLNIGAGHIVYQDLPRINMAIADGDFFTNKSFLAAIQHVKDNNSTLHLMGLIGAGGVHSNIEHLYALLNLCAQQKVERVYIHGFTDGRDSPPTSGINYVQEIINRCEHLGVGQLASLQGRYFAMDRDRRWERVEKAYDALTIGEGNSCILDPVSALKEQYNQGITDEFIEPITICNEDGTHRVVNDNDAAIFFNYRIDRPRELTRAFVLPDFEQGMTNVAFDPYTERYEKTNIQKQVTVNTFQRKKILKNLYFVTMTMYEDHLPAHPAFPPQHIKVPLGKVFADNGLRQLRMTETEKERFVTYYMNGQVEDIYPGEERVIIPSKGVKSYDQAPEMSAHEITNEMVRRIESGLYDVILANICNGDMVGHTGNFQAAVRACEIVDEVVGQIVEAALLHDGAVFITADHGNVEEMMNNSTGEIDTEHSTYPVPFFIISKQFAGKSTMLPSGILADVAPTMLKIMKIPRPEQMTGRALI